jgi:hypothetical protein
MTKQLRTPNPNIPCKPGWCLQYVREAFGIYPGVYPSATAGWANAQYKHPGELPPRGVWTPLWFFMEDEPLGHVVLSAPDGSLYSTSDPSTVPHHHSSLADLMGYYAYWGLPLTYLGWSEDIERVRVVETSDSIEYAGEITPTPTPVTEEVDFMTDMHTFLNTPAFTGGPTISEMFKETHAVHEAIFNNDGTNESILGGFSISGLDNHNAAKILEAVEGLTAEVAELKKDA